MHGELILQNAQGDRFSFLDQTGSLSQVWGQPVSSLQVPSDTSVENCGQDHITAIALSIYRLVKKSDDTIANRTSRSLKSVSPDRS